jgi:hypothetical protein
MVSVGKLSELDSESRTREKAKLNLLFYMPAEGKGSCRRLNAQTRVQLNAQPAASYPLSYCLATLKSCRALSLTGVSMKELLGFRGYMVGMGDVCTLKVSKHSTSYQLRRLKCIYTITFGVMQSPENKRRMGAKGRKHGVWIIEMVWQRATVTGGGKAQQ